MVTSTISKTYVIRLTLVFIASVKITYGSQAAAQSNQRCIPKPSILWSRELSTHPYTATPLITDVDADGQLDIITVSHGGDVHVVRAADGVTLQGWPQKLRHTSVFASPLQYDVDDDGKLDIIITTANGKIISFSSKGERIADKHYQLTPLLVRRDWYQIQLTADENSIHEFILDRTKGVTQHDGETYIEVDAHILASPVLADLNADGRTEELVIPVAYFYDLDDYSGFEATLPQNLTEDEIGYYLAGAAVIFNMTDFTEIHTTHLELTKTTAEYPGYLLFSPTLIDLHGNHSALEIIVATSAGHIHAFDLMGQDVEGFPLHTDSIMGQVSVGDVNQDGMIDLVSQDVSGNVACYSNTGKVQWEAQVSDSVPSGTRLIHHNDVVDIILSSNDGVIYVLSGKTGENLPKWPFKVSDSLNSPPLILPVMDDNIPALAVVGSEGRLNVISMDRKTCRDSVELGEVSLVATLSHDLVLTSPGLELLVATTDGTIACIGSGAMGTPMINASLYAWPAENRVINDFGYWDGKRGLILSKLSNEPQEYTGHIFSLTYTIVDDAFPPGPGDYNLVQVYIGSHRIYSSKHTQPGTYSPSMPCPDRPIQGHLVVEMTSRNGIVFRDMLAVKFHKTALSDLKWLLIGPSIGMTLLLLFLHGYPLTSPLPVSIKSKDR